VQAVGMVLLHVCEVMLGKTLERSNYLVLSFSLLIFIYSSSLTYFSKIGLVPILRAFFTLFLDAKKRGKILT